MSNSKKVKVYCGFISTGTRADSQVYILRELAERYKDEVELVYPEQCVHRVFHDYARNAVVDEFLATDCDILWFLDSDVTPPKHVLDLITQHLDKWVVSGAAYPIFMSQPNEEDRQIVFTAYKGHNGKGIKPTRIPYSGLDYVDGLATGCIFIKREVFDKLEQPYFEFKYDPKSRELKEGEDIGFCLKLNALGIKFFTDYSMVCKHYKNVCLLEMNNYAISYANKAVLAYDNEIRDKVAALATKVQTQAKPKSSLVLPERFKT